MFVGEGLLEDVVGVELQERGTRHILLFQFGSDLVEDHNQGAEGFKLHHVALTSDHHLEEVVDAHGHPDHFVGVAAEVGGQSVVFGVVGQYYGK